jgi:mannose-6-phosphate isomerase-like protein (cupin superfamily)
MMPEQSQSTRLLLKQMLDQATVATGNPHDDEYRNGQALLLGRWLRWLYLWESPEMTIIQERMPVGAAEQMHRHEKSRQFFYVLSGTAIMVHDGVSSTLKARDGLEIAPGVAHQISNHGDIPLEIIVTSMPPSHGDRTNLPGE